jgi:hypothetical protein
VEGSHVGLLERQKDTKDRTASVTWVMPYATADPDAATVFFKDGLADPQAQSGAGDALGREEGLKDARAGGRVHAKSSICYGDEYAFRSSPRIAPGGGSQDATQHIKPVDLGQLQIEQDDLRQESGPTIFWSEQEVDRFFAVRATLMLFAMLAFLRARVVSASWSGSSSTKRIMRSVTASRVWYPIGFLHLLP